MLATLSLETSTPDLVMGYVTSTTQREQTWRVERAHAEKIGLYLEQFGVQKAELIAVGAGPGSYTGVRVAASFALGLARAWNCPVVRVPTLEAIAAREIGVVAVSQNAFRGHVYCAVYEVGSSIKTLVPLEKRVPEDFAALIPDGAKHLEDIAPSGIALAKLAQRRLELGLDVDLLYL